MDHKFSEIDCHVTPLFNFFSGSTSTNAQCIGDYFSIGTYKCLNFSVALGCGSTVSENNTYFVSSSTTSGACTLKICECSDNICQVCPNPSNSTQIIVGRS